MILTNLNQKGGVGKTTNTIHIGACLAMQGNSVLLIDADPQCDLTYATNIEEEINTYDIVDFLDNNTKEFKLQQRADNFFILPGNVDFDASNYDRYALRDAIKDDKGLYAFFDFIFIDVPPEGIKEKYIVPAELALCASDYFITTIQPESFSIKNLDKFLVKVFSLREKHNETLKFAGIYFSMVLVTEKLWKHFKQIVEKNAGDNLLNSFIRRDAELRKTTKLKKTIFQFNPNCRAAWDYKKLTEELLKKVSYKKLEIQKNE